MTTKLFIIDSSVILKLLLKDKDLNSKTDILLEDLKLGKVKLFAPELLKYEVSEVLLKGAQLTQKEAQIALDLLYSLPIQYIQETVQLAKKAYEIGYRYGVSYFDAAFLALTEELEGTLITDTFKTQSKATSIKMLALADYE